MVQNKTPRILFTHKRRMSSVHCSWVTTENPGCTRIIFQIVFCILYSASSLWTTSVFGNCILEFFLITIHKLYWKHDATRSHTRRHADTQTHKWLHTSKQPKMKKHTLWKEPVSFGDSLDKKLFCLYSMYTYIVHPSLLFEQWLCKLCRLLYCCQHFFQ